jgi:hypothetical protein
MMGAGIRSFVFRHDLIVARELSSNYETGPSFFVDTLDSEPCEE